MADPRLTTVHKGNHARYETFDTDNTINYDATKAGGSAQVGLAATVDANKIASLTGDGEVVVGKIISVEPDGRAKIQISGFMTLPGGESATLTLGTKIVGDLGASSAEGYIQSVATQHTVSRGIIIDPSTATAVLVLL